MFNIKLEFIKSLLFNKVWNRKVSALYVTGDKAKENYVALQPYLNFEETFKETKCMEYSIMKRNLKLNLQDILVKYNKYSNILSNIRNLEKEQANIVAKLKELAGSELYDTTSKELKDHGKLLRNQMKELKNTLYPIENDFVCSYLSLPNLLHKCCPVDGTESILYCNTAPTSKKSDVRSSNWKDFIKIIDNKYIYLINDAAQFELDSCQALVRYMMEHGFVQFANPDFVRYVLLEAAWASPLSSYHIVKEQQLKNQLNMFYLTGGAAFESYLGFLTKLSIYPSLLPLQLVCCGRIYNRTEVNDSKILYLYNAPQTNAIQTLVATQTAHEADERFEYILKLCVNFYKTIGIPFRVIYEDSKQLMPSECLRATFQVFSPAQEKYISLGNLSNYGDFISKRILFNVREGKKYSFLHLIGGPILKTTCLLAAMIENGISLDNYNLLDSLKEGAQVNVQLQLQKRQHKF